MLTRTLIKSAARFTTFVLLAAVGVNPVHAEPEKATTRPADTEDPAIRQKGDAIIERALKRYRAAKTYQDRGKTTSRFKFAGSEDSEAQSMEGVMTTRVAMPNKVAMTNEMTPGDQTTTLVCDGARMWVRMSSLSQYIESDAPKDFSDKEGDSIAMQVAQPGPVALVMLCPNKGLRELFPQIKKLTAVEAAERGGRKGTWVRLDASVGEDDSIPPVKVELWFADDTGLLEELKADASEMYKSMYPNDEDEDKKDDDEDEMPGPMRIESMQTSLTLEDIKLDEPIPPDAFKFVPESSDSKVDQFGTDDQENNQDDLIGKPAPKLEGKDLDGKPIKLVDLKGQVVLLDFWATWCGPCVQAMPAVQKLADQFKDKSVSVIGVNRDQPGSNKRIAKFLEKKKITLRQVMDEDGEFAQAFSVQGIPCLVLIDKEGIVQDISVGFHGKEVMAEKIDKLLKGKNLFDPSEIRKSVTTTQPGWKSDSDIAEKTKDLPEFAPDRLTTLTTKSISAWNFTHFDLDGDGVNEVLIPSPTSGSTIHVLAHDPEKDRTIKLSGVRSEQIRALRPARCKNELVVFTELQKYGMQGMSSSSRLALFELNGVCKWSISLPAPEKTTCGTYLATGDLDRDGSLEFIAGISYSSVSRSGGNSWRSSPSKAYLMVLNDKGEQICLKKMGQSISMLEVLQSSTSQPAIIIISDNVRTKRFQFTDLTPPTTQSQKDASRPAAPRDPKAFVCSGNLRGIGQAGAIYAQGNDGAFPETLKALFDENLATPKLMLCPKCTDAGDQFDKCYRIVHGAAQTSDPDRIVVYETAARHGDGAFVLRAGGTVDYISPYSEIEKLVEQQAKNDAK